MDCLTVRVSEIICVHYTETDRGERITRVFIKGVPTSIDLIGVHVSEWPSTREQIVTFRVLPPQT